MFFFPKVFFWFLTACWKYSFLDLFIYSPYTYPAYFIQTLNKNRPWTCPQVADHLMEGRAKNRQKTYIHNPYAVSLQDLNRCCRVRCGCEGHVSRLFSGGLRQSHLIPEQRELPAVGRRERSWGRGASTSGVEAWGVSPSLNDIDEQLSKPRTRK